MKKWPIITSLVVTYFIFAILLNSVGIVILQVIKNFLVSKQNAGLLEGFKDLPIAFVSFFVASFLPKIGYKKAMQLGLLLVAIACFAMPLLPGFLTTKFLFLTIGASFALVKVSVYASIGMLSDTSKSHASMMNVLEGFFMVGVLLGNWLFSLFVQDGSSQWLQIYWILGGACIANALLIYSLKISEPISKACNNKRLQHLKPMMRLCLNAFVMLFVLSTFMYVLIEQSVSTWLPTFNHETLNFDDSDSIKMACLFAASLAIGRLIAGFVLRYVAWQTLLKFCIFCMLLLILSTLPFMGSASLSVDLLGYHLPILAFIFPVMGLFMAPIYPALNSAILTSLPNHQHALMTGLIIIFSAIGGTTGSLITGYLFAHFGGQNAFLMLALPLVVLFFTTQNFYTHTQKQRLATSKSMLAQH